jgi:gluconolactonase
MTLLRWTPLASAVAALTLAAGCAQTPTAPEAAATAAPAAGATFTPGIPGVVSAGTPIEFIKDGFNGTEGPIALADGSLIFTETTGNRITRIAADGSTSSFLEGSNGANGLGFTPNGDLYAAQVLKPQVGIVYPAGHAKVLADKFEGKPFGRPNDLVLDKQGNVYFTDSGANAPRPAAGASAAAPAAAAVETAKPAVYRITNKGQLQRLAADIARPNGIQLSPDEKLLYVANTNGQHLLAYDIKADGSLGPKREFAKLEGGRKLDDGTLATGADGIAVDALGRLYVATPAGVQVVSDKGEVLGTIALPKAPQNLAFAGTDKRTLYVVGRGAAYRINTLTPGFNGRAK